MVLVWIQKIFLFTYWCAF